jgi:hypothetical protein
MAVARTTRPSQRVRREGNDGNDVDGDHHEAAPRGRFVAVLVALAALIIAVGLAVTRMMDHANKRNGRIVISDPACVYKGPNMHPREDSPEAWAMSMGLISASQIGTNWLPVRLALHGTPAQFDAYVTRLQDALCGGAAPRYEVDAEEALQSLDALLQFLRYAATALEAKPVRTGLLVFRHIERANPDVREALKGLFDYGRLHGDTPVPNLEHSPLRFVVALRVPPEINQRDLYNARVQHLMHHITL